METGLRKCMSAYSTIGKLLVDLLMDCIKYHFQIGPFARRLFFVIVYVQLDGYWNFFFILWSFFEI